MEQLSPLYSSSSKRVIFLERPITLRVVCSKFNYQSQRTRTRIRVSSHDKVDHIRGMEIVVVTTANTDDEARELLRRFNFPFVN